MFKQWVVKKWNVSLTNPTSMDSCSFVMGDEAVEIEPEFVSGFLINVKDGFSYVNGSNVYSALEGDKVTLSLNYHSSKRTFKEWKVVQGNVTLLNPTSEYDCTFIMPAEDVVIEAEYIYSSGFYDINVKYGYVYSQNIKEQNHLRSG